MIAKYLRTLTSVLTAVCLTAAGPVAGWSQPQPDHNDPTTTPIKHVVVFFQENISFDHYFGTYPYAVNPAAEPEFHAAPETPRANNLLSGGLLDQNPNTTQPFRLDRTCPLTSDQNHDYTPEQKAFDHGLMDVFVQQTGSAGTNCPAFEGVSVPTGPQIVMGYYDGNICDRSVELGPALCPQRQFLWHDVWSFDRWSAEPRGGINHPLHG